jgi:hypothetical protein
MRCGISSRSIRGAVLASCIAVAAAAVPATAELVLTDPGSDLYYTAALAAGDDAKVGEGCVVSGDVYSNKKVMVMTGGAVQGNVAAVHMAQVEGTVSGTVTSPSPPFELPALFSEEAARALADRVFESHRDFTGETIDDVVFVDGNVRLAGAVGGVGTIIASGHIDVLGGTEGATPPPAPGDRLSLIAFQHVWVRSFRALRGALYAGQHVTLEQGASLEGTAVAQGKLELRDGARVDFLDLDQAPPLITGLAPAPESWNGTRRPEVVADFADDLSTVDPASVQVLLDGEPVTPTEVSSTGFRFVPADDLGPGAHQVAVSLADASDNPASAAWVFRIDTASPVVRFAAPGPTSVSTDLVSGSPVVGLVLDLHDGASGIAAGSLAVAVDGQPVTCDAGAGRPLCESPPLATGPHRATATVADVAGNTASAVLDFTFALDLEPPAVEIEAPAAGSHVAAGPIGVTIRANDDVGLAELRVNGRAVAPSAGVQTVSVDLLEGSNPITVVARDRLRREASSGVEVVLDSVPPSIEVASPAPGSRLNVETVPVRLRVRDDGEIAAVEVAGAAAERDGIEWVADVALAPGANLLPLRAVDRAGNAAETTVELELFALPDVLIDSPADLAWIAATTVEVSGTVSDPAASVVVNGITATVAGGRFTAAGVPLIEGGNLVTASATDGAGRVGTATINVVRDLTPPRLHVRSPRAGAVLVEPSITVSGMVNDVVAGTVNPAQAEVTVNGVAAEVANRSFVAEGVPLEPGVNVLEVRARDAAGNEGDIAVEVLFDPARPSLVKVSGDRQDGTIGEPLAEPLVVEVRDAAGQPLAGAAVLFKVVQGDGAFADGSRRTAATSGAAGRASVPFRLGGRAGAAAQAVEALIVGYAGDAVFTFDVAAGAAADIVVDAGDQQVGVAGQALPRPLVATVIDAGANRLEGVPVLLQVLQGGGRFADGEQLLDAVTDSDGRVVVPFTLGADEGISSNVVSAVVAGVPEAGQATFTASGWAAGDPAATALHGVVLDNTNRPVPGVTLRILDSAQTAVADAEGRFRMQPVPVGTLKLIVDGSTADRPGAWPDLEFVVTTVSGRDNDVGRPIFLLPLDLDNGVFVSETSGGTVTLPEVPGFALEIEPGSVTFPGGAKSGLVSVTAVHADKVPMTPNFGQQPQLIVTIQPAGARFDPPARLTLPNVETLAPGQVTDMYSFDHDLGHFVSIGPALVAEDGAVIRSAPGVGILKAGWHCGGDPAAAGTTHDCPECQKCEGDECVPDDEASPGGPCISVSLSEEIDSATDLAEQALQSVPFVDEVSVMASVSGESCPTCCNGSELNPGEITGGGSITAEAVIEKTLSPIDVPRTEVERTILGIEVEFEVEVALGPFIRGTPVASFDVSVERDLCAGENCVEVQGCGGFTLTVGGQAKSVLEVEVEVGDFDLIDVEVEVVAEASASAPGVARVQYTAGSACADTGWTVDGCLADVTGDIILIVDDFFETTFSWTFFEGTDGCGCG